MTAGFTNNMTLGNFTLNGKPLPTDWTQAIINIFIQRTMMGVDTLTIQLSDPQRKLLTQLVQAGSTVVVDGLSFTLVQFMKSSDQLQLVMESTGVHNMRNQHRGAMTYYQGNTAASSQVTQFLASLAGPAGLKVSGPDYASTWSKLVTTQQQQQINFNGLVALQQGTTTDPYENSWTAASRTSATVGWRMWESNNIIYFGPDEYWLGNLTKGVPPINNAMGLGGKVPILQEFTETVQLIDFDWDIGKAYSQATVTCMLDSFDFQVGEVVQLANVGPASGYWLVAGIQRDFYMPQATLTLQVPMPFTSVFDPTSKPMAGFPLLPSSKLSGFLI